VQCNFRETGTTAVVLTALFIAAGSCATARASELAARWSFETMQDAVTPDAVGRHVGALKGRPGQAPGVEGFSLKLDGRRDYVSVPDARGLSFTDATFSVAAWVNVYSHRDR